MWLIFFVIAIVWVCLLLFYITIEMNQLDKSIEKLMASAKKHYGLESNAPTGQ
jgi:hypothetical protein